MTVCRSHSGEGEDLVLRRWDFQMSTSTGIAGDCRTIRITEHPVNIE